MEDRLGKIEQELRGIKERNAKVEGEKAWEVSFFRKITIAVTTYIIASMALYAIGVPNFLLSALIPTIGYLLSTLSLPGIKDWWIGRRKINS